MVQVQQVYLKVFNHLQEYLDLSEKKKTHLTVECFQVFWSVFFVSLQVILRAFWQKRLNN